MRENGDSGQLQVDGEASDRISHSRKEKKLEKTREQVLDIRWEAHAKMAAGQLSRQQAQRQYRGGLQNLLLQLEPQIERHLDNSDEYLHDLELGHIRFEPPDDLVAYAKDNLIRLVDGVTVPQAKVVSIEGLKAIRELPSPLAKSWAVPTTMDRTSDDVRSGSVQRELSFDVIDEAFQACDRAMHELGLNIEINPEQDDHWDL